MTQALTRAYLAGRFHGPKEVRRATTLAFRESDFAEDAKKWRKSQTPKPPALSAGLMTWLTTMVESHAAARWVAAAIEPMPVPGEP